MLAKAGVRYFQLPQAIDNLLPELTLSSLAIYVHLYHEAQRLSRTRLEASDLELCDRTGMVLNSIRDGRERLRNLGLVNAERIGRGKWAYTLCNPETKQPLISSAPAPPTAPAAPSNPTAPSTASFVEELSSRQKCTYFERRFPGRRKPMPDGFMTICPFHGDTEASLHVNTDNAVWCCHGCGKQGGMVDLELAFGARSKRAALEEVLDRIGRRDLFKPLPSKAEAIYDYPDEAGNPLFQVRRYAGKKFLAFHWEGGRLRRKMGARTVLYRLPEVTKAAVVLVPEGEKDCDRLMGACPPSSGIAATTNPFGAGYWRREFSEYLRGKFVIIFPHNDSPGRAHALDIARSLLGIATEIRIVNLPGLSERGDVSDYLDEHTWEDLVNEIANTPPWHGE